VTWHEKDKDIIHIECRDTGKACLPMRCEMPLNHFLRQKKPGEGTGLGLYISHEIIKKHDGNIAIQSDRGVGTILSVELPCRRRKS